MKRRKLGGLITLALAMNATSVTAGRARPNPKVVARWAKQLEEQKAILERWKAKNPPAGIDLADQRPELLVAEQLEELPEILTKSVWGVGKIRVVPQILECSLEVTDSEDSPNRQLARFFDQLASYYQRYELDVRRIPCKKGTVDLGPFGYSAYPLADKPEYGDRPAVSGFLLEDQSNLGYKPTQANRDLFIKVRLLTDDIASDVAGDFFRAVPRGDEARPFVENLSRFFGRADDELEFPIIDGSDLFAN